MNQDERLDRLDHQVIDLRLAVSALLDTVTLHQRNFDVIAQEWRDIRLDMRDMQAEMRDMQLQVRGLQTENRRILDILQQRQSDVGDDDTPSPS